MEGYALGVCATSLVLRIGGHNFSLAGGFGKQIIASTDSTNDIINESNNPANLLWSVGENLAGVVGNCSDVYASFVVILTVAMIVIARSKELMFDEGPSCFYPYIVAATFTIGLLLCCLFIMIKDPSVEEESYKYPLQIIRRAFIFIGIISVILTIIISLTFLPKRYTFPIGESSIS